VKKEETTVDEFEKLDLLAPSSELLGTSRPKNRADVANVAAFRRLQRGKEYLGNRKTPRKKMTDC
jgi:hypothetical protein